MKSKRFNGEILGLLVSMAFLLGGVSQLLADDSETFVRPVQDEKQIFRTPDYTGDLGRRKALLGDLGGARQQLANDGITLDGSLTQVTQGVVSGGVDYGWNYMGRGEVNLNFDTQKMGLWPGGLLSITGEGNFGSPLNSNTGALLGTNANDLFPETENSFVLPGVVYTQFLSEHFGISLGKFTTITSESGDMNEFAHGKGARQFLNPAFNLNPTTALTIPYSTLGIAGIYVPVKELVVTASVIDPHGDPGNSGVSELFASGATLVSEARYTTDFWGLKGHQLIGATYSTSKYTDLDQRVANLIFPQLPVQKSSGSWSAFWNADQYLYQPDGASDRGVGVFGRYGVSDGNANPIGHFLSFGLGGKGLIPGREHDGFGTGYFYSWTADNRITRQLRFDDAQGWEMYYEIALTPAVFLTPDIQWVQPSQSMFDSSLITGFRLNTVF